MVKLSDINSDTDKLLRFHQTLEAQIRRRQSEAARSKPINLKPLYTQVITETVHPPPKPAHSDDGENSVPVPKVKTIRATRKKVRRALIRKTVSPEKACINGDEDEGTFEGAITRESSVQLSLRDKSGPMFRYMQGIGKSSLLSQEEEVELARRMKQGDKRAQERFINSNLRLVVSIAKRYWRGRRHLHLLDLIQEGNIGLMKAVKRFDPEKTNPETGHAYRFTTYATWWIRQAVERAIGNSDRTVRIPTYLQKRVSTYRRALRKEERSSGHTPTFEKVCSILKLSPDEIDSLRKYFETEWEESLQKPIGEDGDSILGDLLPDESSLNPEGVAANDSLHRHIQEKLGVLNPIQQRVISLRFGLDDGQDRTLQEVCDEVGYTREWIRQIEVEALKKLRRSIDPEMVGMDDKKAVGQKKPNSDLKKFQPRPLTKPREIALKKPLHSRPCT